jgi:O-antigen ligase
VSEPTDDEPPRRRRVKKRRVRPPTAPKPAILRPVPRTDVPALVVFALLVALGPIAFGAVDQFIQVGVLALFALGLALKPPAVLTLTPRASTLILGLLALLVLKEFAPAPLFGSTSWRKTLVGEYGLTFPWTHHPEPGRAVDALLAGLVAVLWFLWVRTLAERRENRSALAWIMFSAAALVAAVSFATKGLDPKAIYGLRYTPGWRGFGPFPNRNHTACFLAIGTIISFGCLAWAGTRRKWIVLGGAAVLAILPLAGLLATESRGGLIGFGAGCVVYVALLLWHYRSMRALAAVTTAAFITLALVFAFGGKLFARFGSPESDVSNQTRVELWRDAIHMWSDAPIFGHGAGSFASIFPMYLRAHLDNQQVLHPESSWLLWLAEFGVLPLLLMVAGTIWFLRPHLREMFTRKHGFALPAAGFAAGIVLLVHSAIDVPGHRWGTAGFALAAFAVALPPIRRGNGNEHEHDFAPPPRGSARSALIPLVIAALWSAPFWADWPQWSPLTANRLVERANAQAGVDTSDLDTELVSFPLNASLHYLRGFHELQRQVPGEEVWLRHFRAALRLMPSSWPLAINEARACAERAPHLAIEFWQQGIGRSDLRAQELFGTALNETKGMPGAREAWSAYVKAHPQLALTFAHSLPADEGRAWFELWWNSRGSRRDTPLQESEIATFYADAAQWATPAQFDEWMRLHSDRGIKDFRAWARVLHAWHQDEAAWRLLTRRLPEFPWPTEASALSREALEQRWKRFPENQMNAQTYATACFRAGDLEAATEVIVSTAKRPDAKSWFTRKAAYLLAAEKKFTEAVEILVNEKPGVGE